MRRCSLKRFVLGALSGWTALAAAQSPSGAYSISAEHVNLIRLDHEKIVNVVYDVEALEIEPDKTRGIVFVRVRPGWLARGNVQTAAFLNSETESYGVTLTADAPASATVTVQTHRTRLESVPEGESLRAVAERLPALPASDFVAQMKAAVRAAANPERLGQRPERLGEAFADEAGAWVRHAVPAVQTSRDGWLLRQSAVVVGRLWRVDVVDVLNARASARALTWGGWFERVPDVVAVATPEGTVRAGGLARVYAVRPVTSDERAAVRVLRDEGGKR